MFLSLKKKSIIFKKNYKTEYTALKVYMYKCIYRKSDRIISDLVFVFVLFHIFKIV